MEHERRHYSTAEGGSKNDITQERNQDLAHISHNRTTITITRLVRGTQPGAQDSDNSSLFSQEDEAFIRSAVSAGKRMNSVVKDQVRKTFGDNRATRLDGFDPIICLVIVSDDGHVCYKKEVCF